MIEKFVASRRKPAWQSPTYNSKPKHIALTGGSALIPTMMAEANRRDAICRALAKECKFKEGDIVIPWSANEQESMGECRVTFIADTYVKFGKHNEWPANDTPHIVSIWSKKQSKSYLCTTTYAKKPE